MEAHLPQNAIPLKRILMKKNPKIDWLLTLCIPRMALERMKETVRVIDVRGDAYRVRVGHAPGEGGSLPGMDRVGRDFDG